MSKRIYHHYEKWEEYHNGMWRKVSGVDFDQFKLKASSLMIDTEAFYQAMLRAVAEWPISCEVNFTNSSVNHQAWLGHAGCCIATGSPEEATRAGWWMLNKAQQDLANNAADNAKAQWAKNYFAKAY